MEITKKVVAELTGETPRTIHFWTDSGLVVPEVENPKGKGKNRKYSEKNVFEFFLIRALLKLRLSLDDVKNIMPFVREGGSKKQGKWHDVLKYPKAHLIIYGPTEKDVFAKFLFSNVGKKNELPLDTKGYTEVSIIDLKSLAEKIKRIIPQ